MRIATFLFALMTLSLLLSPPKLLSTSLADGGPNHRTRNTHFGVSGGNINDRSSAFCCSGTLGSLVQDNNGVQYILSNNHVLARADQAVAGDDISQPGLIDNGCQVPPIVADFTVASPLGSNVDAAIAQLRPGTMDSSGFIEDIGVPSSTVATPAVGLSVVKSGRTTGFQTGTIGSVNTSVKVQYQKGCNQGKKFTVSYTNQVVINSSTFSAGGDSGSLIVTNDGAHQPVALLFAGSSSSTIGNPIGEVLSKMSTALGRPVCFGGNCASINSSSSAGATSTTSSPRSGQLPGPAQEAIERARRIMVENHDDLMSRSGVIGVGVGASDTNASEAAIVVYLDRTTGNRPSLPLRLDGVRVRSVQTDPFVAY